MKRTGIYRILNKINGKSYIGSSNDVIVRIQHHKHNLRKNSHENSHLQNAWNKYGGENFKFIILLLCTQKILIEKEQLMIDFYDTYISGYNLCPAAGSCLGFKHSKESKEKMKGNVNGRGGKGRKHSKETKQKQREAKIGKVAGMKDKKHSVETKEKMRVAKLGKPSPNKGQKSSAETRKKQSLSHKGHNIGMTYKKRKTSLRGRA